MHHLSKYAWLIIGACFQGVQVPNGLIGNICVINIKYYLISKVL